MSSSSSSSSSPPLSTTATAITPSEEKRKALLSLDIQRKSLESEADAIISELLAPLEDGTGPPMGIDTPLVDMEGYPRADIDVYRARTLRKRLNEIKTDRKGLMKKIELGVLEMNAASNPTLSAKNQSEREARQAPKPKPKHDPQTGKWVVKNWDGTVAGIENGHKRTFDELDTPNTPPNTETSASSSSSSTTSSNNPATTTPVPSSLPTPPTVPFAIVDAVAVDSPAEVAGLHEGDFIIQFGPLNHLNHDNLRAIAALVPAVASEDDGVINICVLRRRRMSDAHDMEHDVEAGVRFMAWLRLRPRPWGGRGLLGCHIVAFDEVSAARYAEPHS